MLLLPLWGDLDGWEGYVGGAVPEPSDAIVHIHWGICTWAQASWTVSGGSQSLAATGSCMHGAVTPSHLKARTL